MSKIKKDELKANVKNEPKYLDDNFEDILIRFIDGANFPSIALELKELKLDDISKRAIVRCSLAAAIGVRRTVSEVTNKELAVVSTIKGFTLNNAISMSKLTIIGHALLRSQHSGKLGVLWRAKLGGASSIFETSAYGNMSEKRIKVVENVKLKKLFSVESAEDIVSTLMD